MEDEIEESGDERLKLRWLSSGRGLHIFDQLPSPSDDEQPIEVEERKPRSFGALDDESRPLEQRSEGGRGLVRPVADVAIESGHRTAGHGDHDTAVRAKVCGCVPE